MRIEKRAPFSLCVCNKRGRDGIQSCHGTTNLFSFSKIPRKIARFSPCWQLPRSCKSQGREPFFGAAPCHLASMHEAIDQSIEVPFFFPCKNRLYSLCSFSPAFLRPGSGPCALFGRRVLPLISPLITGVVWTVECRQAGAAACSSAGSFAATALRSSAH